MWIVRLALRRPYTFVVLAVLILLMGALTLARMPTDIFPQIDIPVVAAVWSYTGLPPSEMEGRVTSQFERAATTTVSGIEHIESQTLAGVAVIKIFLQPGTSLDGAVAEVASIAGTILKQLPPGATPPLVLRYSASDTSVVQLGLSSATLNEQQIYDLATNFVRPGLATVRGAQLPLPIGGKVRQVTVDLDLEKLFAWGLSPSDVSAAVNVQNLILPSGTAKMGKQEYPILVNSSPSVVDAFNALPVKTVKGTTVYLGDVAHVRDGYAPQTSVVVTDGARGALLPVLKSRGASTLDVVAGVRAALPRVLSTVSKELDVKPLFDQSVFVRGAINGVIREAAIAAGLTGLMMLLFLGSWRSTVIVLVSIPLSLLVSIIVLDRFGQTLNLMTLGGLALAVGILVDDATVEIENFHRNRAMNKPVVQAILDGAAEIAAPAFVSTLCICIVFVPVSFISGAARSLFVPLGMAIVFAMLTSYFLSRTLVPTMEHFLLAKESPGESGSRGPIARAHGWIERGFERLRDAYSRALAAALARRRTFVAGFLAFAALSLGLVPLLGQNFFPAIDAGQMRLHVRAPPGTRIEETQRLFADVEARVRRIVPAGELAMALDDIGEPVSGINLALGDPSMISTADGEMLIALAANHHPTADYVRAIRRDLASAFPDAVFFFLPADISTQVLNFGLSAPIDVRLSGPQRNQPANVGLGREIARRITAVPGAVDVHLNQVIDTPELLVTIDRTLASQVGLTTQQVASALLVSLSSSGQTAPNFWLDQRTGIQYLVAVQTPQYRVDSIDSLQATPLAAPPPGGQPQLLANVAGVSRLVGPTNITHYNVGPTIDVLANVDGTDLGSVATAVRRIANETRGRLPRGTSLSVEGQPRSMGASFLGLGLGLGFAVVLVYALMVVNFQSWLDPLIILMALPGALAGIAWMLLVTHTPLSVPALMGSLMTVGVATANSILVVMFANDVRREGHDAPGAALEAGRTRLRPVMMTAIAMILGMLPMALGLGDGGEQNAPLGRAVIGGLLFATVSTLLFVPVMYSLLSRDARATDRRDTLAGGAS
jgi:multidrug efflux pump subunit AcrB